MRVPIFSFKSVFKPRYFQREMEVNSHFNHFLHCIKIWMSKSTISVEFRIAVWVVSFGPPLASSGQKALKQPPCSLNAAYYAKEMIDLSVESEYYGRKVLYLNRFRFQMLMVRFNEAQTTGNYASSNTPTPLQRVGRPSRRPKLPQKPRLTPSCKFRMA